MTLNRIALLSMLLVGGVLLAIALFALLVPMDFSISAPGRVMPDKQLAVSFPDDGRLSRVFPGAAFKRGDALAALDSSREERELAACAQERRLLEDELALLGRVEGWDAEERRFEIDRLGLRLSRQDMELGALKSQATIYKDLSEIVRGRKQLDEDLSEEALNIYTSLYEKHLVPKIDFLRLVHDRRSSEVMMKELLLQERKQIFENELQTARVEAEKSLAEQELRHRRLRPDALRSYFEVKSRLLALDGREELLRQDVERKLFRAPFDGEVLRRQGRAGEVARKGEPVLLAASLGRVFVAVVNQDHRDEFKPGAEAKIYLDNFGFQEYGLVAATLEDIQTDLAAPEASYILKLRMRDAFRDFEPGLSGRAEIKVFRGTLAGYFMRK